MASSNDSGNPNNSNGKKNGSNSWIIWVIISLLFAVGAWPVALVILFLKLFAPDVKKSERRQAPPLSRTAKDPYEAGEVKEQMRKAFTKETERAVRNAFNSPRKAATSAVLIAVGLTMFLLFFAVALSFIGEAGALSPLFFTLALALGGGAMAARGFLSRAALKRYAKYKSVIGSNQAMEIDSVARKTGYSSKRAARDLQNMIDLGYFGPSAYLNKELGYLFMSTEADAELSAARKAAEEKSRAMSAAESARASADSYERILQQIRDLNQRIPDKVMTEKIDRIENITSEIFKAVQRDPEKKKKIDRFMSYFLPTTLKLLDSYSKLQDTNIEGGNISSSKKSIETAMDTIVDGFEKQLDDLYKTEAFTIEAEIDAMTKMMEAQKNAGFGTARSGGGTSKSFSGGAAVQTAPEDK